MARFRIRVILVRPPTNKRTAHFCGISRQSGSGWRRRSDGRWGQHRRAFWKASPEPGAICPSEDAPAGDGRLDMEVIDLGPTQLKDIARPIRAYSLRVGVPAQASPRPRRISELAGLCLLRHPKRFCRPNLKAESR